MKHARQSTLSLRDWPASERPRERLLRHGSAALSDAELLAIVIGGGAAGHGSGVETCRKLLGRFDGLRGLFGAGLGELRRQPGIGAARGCALVALGELGRRLSADWARPRPGPLSCSAEVYRLLLPRLLGLRQEVFIAVALDARNRVRAVHRVAAGTATSVEVHPREVYGPLLRDGAAAAIVAHNHPSGDPEPSGDDLALTERLAGVGQLMGVPLLDHLIIGDAGYVSLADRGLLPSEPATC
jgi:DNA repair protein RadC